MTKWRELSIGIGILIVLFLAAQLQYYYEGRRHTNARPAVGSPTEASNPRYMPPITLDEFNCSAITDSSFITRLCYRRADGRVVVTMSGVDYEYCNVPAAAVNAWLTAPSMGRYFNTEVRGQYGCQGLR